MKITTYNSADKDLWLKDRIGKIGGSNLGDIITLKGTGKKIGYYQLIADRLGIPADDENRMERGHRLETEAIARFEKETGKKVDTSLVMWTSEFNESISVSPDGFIGDKEAIAVASNGTREAIVKVATEVKCLSSARHIEALITKEIPKDYQFQRLQYFIVNPNLETLYWIFYDPNVIAKDYFVFEINRKDIEADIQKYFEYQVATLAEIDAIVLELTLN